MGTTKIEDLITYNPETGEFKWLDNTGKKNKEWFQPKPRGMKNKTYVRCQSININKKWYSPHRLAWYLMKGYWPLQIDHINRNALDNKFLNLREVTNKENSENRQGKGWQKQGKKYRTKIVVDGQQIYLGTYDTPEEAQTVYLEAKKKYHKAYIHDPKI